MLNFESVSILLFSFLFLYDTRYALIFLFVTQLFANIIPGLNFVSFFGALFPIVTLLYFATLLLIKLYRVRERTHQLPADVKALAIYLIAASIISFAFDSDIRYWESLPVLSAFLICVVAEYISGNQPSLVSQLDKILLGSFFLLFASFALEFILNKPLFTILGKEGLVHGGYLDGKIVLHGLFGNNNESTGAMVALFPMYFLHASKHNRIESRSNVAIIGLTYLFTFRTYNLTGIIALLAITHLLGVIRLKYLFYIVVLGVAWTLKFTPDLSLLLDFVGSKSAFHQNGSLFERIYNIWIPHLKLWSESWSAILVGYGANSWAAMTQERLWDPLGQRFVAPSPHNFWIYYLFTQGLLGLTLFANIFVTNFFRAFRMISPEKWYYVASLLALFFWTLTSNSHRNYGLLIMMSLCLLVGAKSREEDEEDFDAENISHNASAQLQ